MTRGWDLLVRTENAESLDATVRSLPGVMSIVVDGSWDPVLKVARVRCFGDFNFLKFAVSQQGYGEIVGEEPYE